MPQEKEQTLQISGITYHYLLEGPPPSSSPLILLIHALMSNMRMWDSTVQILHSAGYATLRFDHIGHGRTPPPPPPPISQTSLERSGNDDDDDDDDDDDNDDDDNDDDVPLHMDDLVQHMRILVEHVTTSSKATKGKKLEGIIGCSIGGVLALRYAMLNPDQEIKNIVSIAAPGISTPTKAKRLWPERVREFEKDVREGGEGLCHATVQRWFPGNTDLDVRARDKSLEHVRGCSLEGYRVLAEAIANYDFREEVSQGKLRGVRCLIVAGSEDGAIDVEGLRGLARGIEGAEFVLMEAAGHLPPLQMEGEFEGIMMRFLKGGGDGGG